MRDEGIYDIRAILLSTSKGHQGGDISYARLRHNVTTLLKQEQDILVTTLIDFFRLKTDFPRFAEAKSIDDKINRVTFLESAVAEDIDHPRFIPYIQLHELEGLLFSSEVGFSNIPNIPARSKMELQQIIASYANPEMINDGAETAPSKRLERLIPGYQKKLMGPYIAIDVTLPVIMNRCERFRNWLEVLVARMKN